MRDSLQAFSVAEGKLVRKLVRKILRKIKKTSFNKSFKVTKDIIENH